MYIIANATTPVHPRSTRPIYNIYISDTHTHTCIYIMIFSLPEERHHRRYIYHTYKCTTKDRLCDLLILPRSTSPPPRSVPSACVLVCSLYYKPSVFCIRSTPRSPCSRRRRPIYIKHTNIRHDILLFLFQINAAIAVLKKKATEAGKAAAAESAGAAVAEAEALAAAFVAGSPYLVALLDTEADAKVVEAAVAAIAAVVKEVPILVLGAGKTVRGFIYIYIYIYK